MHPLHTYLLTQNCFYLLMSLYIFATEHGYNAFFVPNTINFVTLSLNKHSKMQFCICVGHLGFYLEFYLLPSFTQVLLSRGFTHQPWINMLIGGTALIKTNDVQTIHQATAPGCGFSWICNAVDLIYVFCIIWTSSKPMVLYLLGPIIGICVIKTVCGPPCVCLIAYCNIVCYCLILYNIMWQIIDTFWSVSQEETWYNFDVILALEYALDVMQWICECMHCQFLCALFLQQEQHTKVLLSSRHGDLGPVQVTLSIQQG